MRVFLLACSIFLLFSCNSSSKKDPNQAMDDTARMRNPTRNAQTREAIEPVKVATADLPTSITIKGKVQEAWKWNDRLGENLLITTSKMLRADKDEYAQEVQSAEIYAFHYTKQDRGYVQIGLMSDAEKSCPLDITCDFIPGSTTITDLDKDGIAEIKVQYSLACRGDVSPATMKLIMYENRVKYELRGKMWLKSSPEDKFTVTENDVNLEKLPKLNDEFDELLRTFGRYENEKEFATAPPGFLTFARNEWLKHVKEKMGE